MSRRQQTLPPFSLLEAPRRERVVQALKQIGFDWVALDLQGFRSGSLNAVLDRQKHEGPGG